MELALIIISLFQVGMIIVLVFLAARLRRGDSAERQERTLESGLNALKADLTSQQMKGLVSLRESLDSASRLVNERLSEGTSVLDKRLELFTNIEAKLGELTNQTKHLEQMGEEIQSFSDLLKPPKLRGIFGELLLENLLQQIFPAALFELQYQFASGVRVDAVVKLGDRLLPIDSKFPLEAFERLVANESDPAAHKDFVRVVKKHIDDIARRYVNPLENTTDIAIMYIPAEAIYYQFIAREEPEALAYALSKKVVPSSPGHLYGFLASLSAVFRSVGISANSRKLSDTLSEMSQALKSLGGWHDRIEGSLRAINTSFVKARAETANIGGSLDSLQEPTVSDFQGAKDEKEEHTASSKNSSD